MQAMQALSVGFSFVACMIICHSPSFAEKKKGSESSQRNFLQKRLPKCLYTFPVCGVCHTIALHGTALYCTPYRPVHCTAVSVTETVLALKRAFRK
jgi:hypothetical protein